MILPWAEELFEGLDRIRPADYRKVLADTDRQRQSPEVTWTPDASVLAMGGVSLIGGTGLSQSNIVGSVQVFNNSIDSDVAGITLLGGFGRLPRLPVGTWSLARLSPVTRSHTPPPSLDRPAQRGSALSAGSSNQPKTAC